MAKRSDPHLERITKALEAASSRSKLARWMTANHEGFAEALRQHGANWSVLTESFKAEGLMAADAKPEAAKRTWQRVRKRLVARQPAKPVVHHVSGHRVGVVFGPVDEPDDDGEIELISATGKRIK